MGIDYLESPIKMLDRYIVETQRLHENYDIRTMGSKSEVDLYKSIQVTDVET